MALNTTGPISLGGPIVGQSVNLELGNAANATISMGSTAYRNFVGAPASGPVTAGAAYGKSNVTGYIVNVELTCSGNMNPVGPAWAWSGTFPPSWNSAAYWAIFNSNPEVLESNYCQGYPTFSYDLCLSDWGVSLGGITGNPAYNNITKVECCDYTGAVKATINKSSFITYSDPSGSGLGTCVRIPGVPSSLYFTMPNPNYPDKTYPLLYDGYGNKSSIKFYFSS